MEWKKYCKMEYLEGIPKGYIISLRHLNLSEAEICLVKGSKGVKMNYGDEKTMRRIAGEWAIALIDEFKEETP